MKNVPHPLTVRAGGLPASADSGNGQLFNASYLFNASHCCIIFLYFLLSFAVKAAPSAKPTSLLLSENSKATVPITISTGADDTVKANAKELADILGKITGATFEIKTGAGDSGIVVGTLAQFPVAELRKPLEIRGGIDGREAYAIRTEKERVLLLGGSEPGVTHAVFRFLETLGYRHFFPAKEWEIIPSKSTIRYNVNESSRPAMLARGIWYGYGPFPDHDAPFFQSRSWLDYLAWKRHNRQGESIKVHTGHAWQSVIWENKDEFEKHPEYLALVNGKRMSKENNPAYPESQLCVSNPAVRKILVDSALNYFRTTPSADMFSVDPTDGNAHCECEECKKLGSISDRVFGVANEVARAVAKEFPGKTVGLNAYSAHSDPPSFNLEPNVYVSLTRGFNMGKYSFDELFQLWPKKCANLGYYEYFSVWLWDRDLVPGGRAANINYVRQQIGRYAAANAKFLSAESGNNWGPHGRGYYLASRLMWNPSADADAILADFYDKAFGPAAPAMKRYYDRLDPGSGPWAGEGLTALALRDLQEASILAKDRPDVLTRLAQLKNYMHYVCLRQAYDAQTDPAKQKELALAILTHVYRSRYSYMNHWRAMETSWAGEVSLKFKEPKWSLNNAYGDRPWDKDTDYTLPETEQLFQTDLASLKPPPAWVEQEIHYSGNLVPVRFQSAASTSYGLWSTDAGYALYSAAGEPLKFDILIQPLYQNPTDPAHYTLQNSAGKVVAQGTIPPAADKQSLQLTVPAAGLYRFNLKKPGNLWAAYWPDNLTYSLEMPRDGSYNHAGSMPPQYFYVPRGTRNLNFYAGAGYPYSIYSPDGKVAMAVPGGGGYLSLPVEQGMDGKVWSLRGFVLYHLWFFNVPNILSGNPNTLLLPREVVEKDGLTAP